MDAHDQEYCEEASEAGQTFRVQEEGWEIEIRSYETYNKGADR